MNGIAFLSLNDFVEENYGIEVWEEILDEVKPECQGIYTAVENYPDEELARYVGVISKRLDITTSEVTFVFGKHLFADLNGKHPIFSKIFDNLFDFLCSIEGVIHKEVVKLINDPSLPKIHCEKKSETEVVMHYSSPRKLCYLAEGLIHGAAQHYDEKIEIHHDQCMHRGAEECILRIIRHV